MPIINRIAAFHEDMTAWRRDLHAHPELSMQEARTSAMVREKLAAFGVDEIINGMATHGVVGVIRSGSSDRAIGLRADMDALPIQEETGLPHASRTPGVMHACGHDGHTAMLLGAAKYLAETRNFDGTVYLIFQPAEEFEGGADRMVQDGLFARCPMDHVYGLHNWPETKAGTFLWRTGPVMAAVAFFDITVTGRGSHGASPHQGVDPIVVSSHIVGALQTIVSRNIEPIEGGVVSVGSITGGDAYNILPERVVMKGTARWYRPEVGDQIEAGMKRLVNGIAESFGARAELNFFRHAPATVNDADATVLAREAATAVAGTDRVQQMRAPTMGGEDFAYMLEAKDGAYLMLGSGRGEDDPLLHHPRYDFNDEVLPLGASWWATLVEQQLAKA
ncbi:MAG TPA: M20 aminoacylase family protein [Rhodopila sp.]|uniref:M20 aminoacylase family protein n=1 Tax=Rhodopila sp. TaxID=2480087 RepID=UPI002C44FB9B|nr:M20 aminoacylase family protein [Rhodopila sp.]HVY16742.1 M20 aminoacylase family protein [Rhodopila sp.]